VEKSTQRPGMLRLLVGMFFVLAALQLLQALVDAPDGRLVAAHLVAAVGFAAGAFGQLVNLKRREMGRTAMTVGRALRLLRSDGLDRTMAQRWIALSVGAVVLLVIALVLYVA